MPCRGEAAWLKPGEEPGTWGGLAAKWNLSFPGGSNPPAPLAINQGHAMTTQKKPNDAAPLIGINCDLASGYVVCPQAYVDCVARAGGVPLLVPPGSNVETLLGNVAGVVMIGGADLDPRNDGFQLHGSQRLMHPRREAFDRELVHEIRERQLPLLAIGVGMQTLNVVCGGTLLLDIATDLPEAMPHRCPNEPLHRHAIVCQPDSIVSRMCNMSRVLGLPESSVGSQHHQAVDDVAPGFRATAHAMDSVVEAIESTSDWWAVGLQWHPQGTGARKIERLIFDEFIKAAKGKVVT